MFAPGDVIKFWSDIAQKKKYHLCISLQGCFLFLNSYKGRSYAGDLLVDCSRIPCLDPTKTNKSVISCSMVVRMTEDDLRHTKAEKIGTVSTLLLREVLRFIEASPVLSSDDKDAVLDGLGDWL